MAKQKLVKQLIVIVDNDGRIVGASGEAIDATPARDVRKRRMLTGMQPLPGQSIHVVEIAEDLSRKPAIDLSGWLSEHRVETGTTPRLVRRQQ